VKRKERGKKAKKGGRKQKKRNEKGYQENTLLHIQTVTNPFLL
jgi:ribosomal protein S25